MENGVPATSPEHFPSIGPPSIATKGFGLKKWRRFRRGSAKMDYGFIGDNNKVLKRDFSMSTTPVTMASQSSGSQSSAPNPFPVIHFDGFFIKDGHKSETGSVSVFSGIPQEISYKISRSCSTVIGGLNTELGKDGVDNIISSNAKAVRDGAEITSKHRGDAMDRESSLCSGESESGSNLQPAGFLCAGESKMDGISGSLLDDFDDGLYLEDDHTAKHGATTPSSTDDIFTQIILLLQIAHNSLENEKKKLMELTTLLCGPKHVEVKTTKEQVHTATILEEEHSHHHPHCWEVGEDGVKIEGEMENEEELFGNKIEYEIKYAIILGAIKEVKENELFGNKIESEIKYVKEKRRKTRLFRTVSCLLLLLTLLLFYNVLPRSTTTTTTPT